MGLICPIGPILEEIMGKLTGALMFVVAIGSVLLFIGQPMLFGSRLWWFPEGISQHAAAIDAQFLRTLVVVGISFTAAQFALGYAVIRFGRKGSERAVYVSFNDGDEWQRFCL